MEKYKQKSSKLNLSIIITSVICLIFTVFILVFNKQIAVSDILTDNETGNNIYYLKSLDYSSFDSTNFEFPYVTVRPDKLDLDKELNLAKKGISDPLETSTRRLVQIYNWKDEYFFKNKLFIKENSETGILSWEDILSNYFSLLETKVELIKKENLSLYEEKADYLKVRTIINIHYPVFFQIVNGLNKANEKKQYLAQIINDNYKQILQKLNVEDISYNPVEYTFSLQEIVKYSDYGKYKLSLLNNYFDLNSSIKLYFNQIEVRNISADFIKYNGIINYEEISLTGEQDKISMIINNKNPLNEGKWYESTLQDGQFLYQIQLPVNGTNKKYFFSLDAIIPTEGRFWIDENYFDSLSNLSKTISIDNQINFQKDSPISYKKKILLPDKNNKKDISFNIISKEKITKEGIKNLKLDWIPIYNPILLAEKINNGNDIEPSTNITKISKNNYLLEMININKENMVNIKNKLKAEWNINNEVINGNTISINLSNKQYKLLINLFLISIIALILLLLTKLNGHFKICHKLILLFKNAYFKLARRMVIFANKFRWLFLLLVIITFMISIFNYKDVSGKIYILFIFGLIFSSFSFSIDSELLISIVIVFLLFSCGFRIILKLNIAEWFAVWSYILLLSIVLIEIINRNQNKNKIIDKLIKIITNYITEMKK